MLYFLMILSALEVIQDFCFTKIVTLFNKKYETFYTNTPNMLQNLSNYTRHQIKKLKLYKSNKFSKNIFIFISFFLVNYSELLHCLLITGKKLISTLDMMPDCHKIRLVYWVCSWFKPMNLCLRKSITRKEFN